MRAAFADLERAAASEATVLVLGETGTGKDLAAKASKVVSKAPTDALEPVWLADGRHVICTYRAANTRSLYLIDTESGKATRLSPAAMGNTSGASYLIP